MKIIYGVSGEGFGHSTRADKVIKYLQGKGHEVLVLTYGQSFKPLSKFNIKRIDGVKILYNKKTLLLGRTLIYNLAWFFRNLKNFNILKEEIKRFNPSVIITDMEPLTSRIAKSLKLPLISLDNEHMLTHSNLKIKKNMNYYIAKMSIENCVPNPDKIIAAHYHRIDVGNENVKIVDPVLRDEIVNLRSVKGDFILVYLTKPDEEIVNLLWNINQSFILYGLGEGYGKFRNIKFKEFGKSFLSDLGNCKAIISNAGFSLTSEAFYLKKPFFAIPLKGQYEQMFNALYVKDLGFGEYSFNPKIKEIELFLGNLDKYESALKHYQINPNQGLEVLNKYLKEIERK